MHRFCRFEKYIQSVSFLDRYLSTRIERHALKSALTHFEKCESTASDLQTRGLFISDARQTLDQVCEDYPYVAYHFVADAVLVQNKAFEGAITKIVSTKKAKITASERIDVPEVKRSFKQLLSDTMTKRCVYGAFVILQKS